MTRQLGSLARLLFAAVLLGSIPVLARDRDDQGDDHGDAAERPTQARTQLVRPDPAVDDNAAGEVRLREHRGRSAIHVLVRHLAKGEVFDVTITKGEQTESLGSITIPPGEGRDNDNAGKPRCFEAAMDFSQEVPAPPVASDATGMAHVQLSRRDRSILRYQVVVEGLTGPAIASHIHSGAPGVAGPPVITLDHETLRGSVEVTPEQIELLESGNAYVNVHTEANTGGEIRGQLTVCADDDGDDDAEGDDEGSDDGSSDGEGNEMETEGNGKLKIDTGRGDSLPLGAAGVADLVGSTVKVLNAAGDVVLSGDIADLENHHFGDGSRPSDVPKGPPDGKGRPGDDGAGEDSGGGGMVQAIAPVFEEFIFDIGGLHDASFRRGDANLDGSIDISDPIRVLGVLFLGDRQPYCRDAADANDDGFLDISDAVALLQALFLGDAALPLPGSDGRTGFDRTPDDLLCSELDLY